jgi:hypothetical protein
MHRTAALALLLAAGAGTAAAAPDPAADHRDMRCVAVMAIALQQAKTPEVKQGTAAGLGYFAGRLKGRDPDFDLPTRLLADLKDVKTVEEFKPDILRCATELKAFGREAQAAGEALKALGAQAPAATD